MLDSLCEEAVEQILKMVEGESVRTSLVKAGETIG